MPTVHDRIEANPRVMLGKPVIQGTRIPVELMLRKLGEGATEADLLDAYPHLTLEDIRAAVAYAADRTEKKPDQLPSAIHEMVRRIVARFDPQQIILFGSYARGTDGPDSDADLLVVMDVQGPKRPVVAEMYRELGGVGLAKDLILITPGELEQHRDDPGFVIYTALREGEVLHDRTRQPAGLKRMVEA